MQVITIQEVDAFEFMTSIIIMGWILHAGKNRRVSSIAVTYMTVHMVTAIATAAVPRARFSGKPRL